MNRDCPTCTHYQHVDEEVQLCKHGVTYAGRYKIEAVDTKEMRSDTWWGKLGCGSEAKLWTPRSTQ